MDVKANKITPKAWNSVYACIYWINIPENAAYSDEAFKLLDRIEQDRAKSLRQKHTRTVFILTRNALRRILGDQLNRPPETIKFSYGTYGKPELQYDCQTADEPLYFNVSHSKDYAVIVVCRNRRVGVDIEYCRRDRPRHMQIARRYFSRNEIKTLESIKRDLRLRSFYDCWARKEAYAKGLGLGIQIGLESFDTGLNFISPADISPPQQSDSGTQQWSVHNLDINRDYAAAVSIECEAEAAKLTLKQFRHNSFR